ncbi:MAG: transcriptional regulator [Bacilli bacterium]|nr:transcriptional regulator [Bacilli bacterium]
METIGKRFKYLRKLAGINQLDFARAIGLSQGRLSDIESNHNKPSADTLISVMEYFGASTDWLLLGLGPSPTRIRLASDFEKENEEVKEPLTWNEEFLKLIHQLSDEEKHGILNFIQFTIMNRSAYSQLSKHRPLI